MGTLGAVRFLCSRYMLDFPFCIHIQLSALYLLFFPSDHEPRFWDLRKKEFVIFFNCGSHRGGSEMEFILPLLCSLLTLSECLFFFGIYSFHICGSEKLWFLNFWRLQSHPLFIDNQNFYKYSRPDGGSAMIRSQVGGTIAHPPPPARNT